MSPDTSPTSNRQGTSSCTPPLAESAVPSAELPLELKEGATIDRIPAAVPPVSAPPPKPAPSVEEPATCRPGAEEKGKGRAAEDLLERFSCHVCFEVPAEPVVTPCGHVHCWPCMHEWLVVSNGRACPVCKTPLTVEKLVPIYSGAGEEADPRSKPIPPRPRPATAAVAPSYRSNNVASTAFSLQAGLFPLPGLSFGWSWPPTPPIGAADAPILALQDPRAPGTILVAPGTARREIDWRTALMQQVFMVLFFAVFVAITFAG